MNTARNSQDSFELAVASACAAKDFGKLMAVWFPTGHLRDLASTATRGELSNRGDSRTKQIRSGRFDVALTSGCVAEIRRVLPGVVIEVRMDSAFFSDELIEALAQAKVEFSISVPFERFTELKGFTEQRQRWTPLGTDTWYFEKSWKPKCWDREFRFVFVRTQTKKQQKGPIQLDLFVPHEYGYEFKVIVTNKLVQADTLVTYHEGRGSQEGVFAELKTNCHLDYIPVQRWHGNQTYLLAGLFAHNLMRDLQMQTSAPSRSTTRQRATWWAFEKLDTFRKTLIKNDELWNAQANKASV